MNMGSHKIHRLNNLQLDQFLLEIQSLHFEHLLVLSSVSANTNVVCIVIVECPYLKYENLLLHYNIFPTALHLNKREYCRYLTLETQYHQQIYPRKHLEPK